MSAASTLSSRRVLVTGANGFLGNHLVRRLLDEGYTVRAFVRKLTSLPGDLPRLEVVIGDIRDASAVDQAVSGCDQVYHLAAAYRDASIPKQEYRQVHVDGTKHVLEACLKHGVTRLIHCSTVGVHGHVAHIPSTELSPFNPGDEYQRTKLEGEQRVWEFAARHALPFSIVRPAAMYGPGDLRFLKFFRAIQRGLFVMLGSGRTHYHLVYIDDLVNGFLLCGTQEAALGQVFIIGSDRYVTLNEFAGGVAEALKVRAPRWRLPVWPVYAAGAVCEAICVPLHLRPPLYRRRVDFFTHERAFDISKAKRLLGYDPQVRLQEGLRRTAEWYGLHGHLVRG